LKAGCRLGGVTHGASRFWLSKSIFGLSEFVVFSSLIDRDISILEIFNFCEMTKRSGADFYLLPARCAPHAK